MGFENIHNYYEQLVIRQIHESVGPASESDAQDGFLEDVACVALNQLSPRYVRHDVDLVFYMSPEERQQNEKAVADAVSHALSFVRERRSQRQ